MLKITGYILLCLLCVATIPIKSTKPVAQKAFSLVTICLTVMWMLEALDCL